MIRKASRVKLKPSQCVPNTSKIMWFYGFKNDLCKTYSIRHSSETRRIQPLLRSVYRRAIYYKLILQCIIIYNFQHFVTSESNTHTENKNQFRICLICIFILCIQIKKKIHRIKCHAYLLSYQLIQQFIFKSPLFNIKKI